MNRKFLAKQVNPIADSEQKFGKIRFIHKDGKEHCFYSAVNEMSGNRLSAFNVDAPSIDDSLKWVRSVFKNIRAKAQVLEVVGDF